MSCTDEVILWCIAFSTSIFFLYYTIIRIKFPDMCDGKSIVDISKFILEFNDTKITTHKENKKYIKAMFFKMVDFLLSPYLFILKLLDFFINVIVWLIEWLFR